MSRRQFALGAAAMSACGKSTPAPEQKGAALSEARSVVRVVAASSTVDGAGVRLSRAIGARALSMVDPFLLLDEIRSRDPADYAAGFPRHPHRGFETVTIMLEGAMEHQDSIGNKGRLVGGSVQWMTAGHGIIHSEMPRQDRGTSLWGLQLWVNLPKRLKMTAPRYQDIAPERVPEAGAARTRVLAGEHAGVKGPVEGIVVAPTLLDVSLTPSAELAHELPSGHSAIVYVLSGVAQIGPERTSVPARSLAILGGGTVLTMRASEPARALVIAAAPLDEPVARRGPFVMNTEEELDRAWDDYQTGRLLEGA